MGPVSGDPQPRRWALPAPPRDLNCVNCYAAPSAERRRRRTTPPVGVRSKASPARRAGTGAAMRAADSAGGFSRSGNRGAAGAGSSSLAAWRSRDSSIDTASIAVPSAGASSSSAAGVGCARATLAPAGTRGARRAPRARTGPRAGSAALGRPIGAVAARAAAPASSSRISPTVAPRTAARTAVARSEVRRSRARANGVRLGFTAVGVVPQRSALRQEASAPRLRSGSRLSLEEHRRRDCGGLYLPRRRSTVGACFKILSLRIAMKSWRVRGSVSWNAMLRRWKGRE
jgi:hypothetical protein